MNRTGRASVVVLVVIVCLCLGGFLAFSLGSGAVLSRVISDSPERASEVGGSIVDYTLPFGYQETGSLSLLGFKSVYIAPVSGAPAATPGTMIMLIAMPGALAGQAGEVRGAVISAFMGSSDEISTMGTVEHGSVMIGGVEVSLEVQETFGQYDTPFRMVFSGEFPAKSGQAILVAAGPISTWDQGSIDLFIRSIQ